MKTSIFILLVSAGIASIAKAPADESVSPVAKSARVLFDPTQTASDNAVLPARLRTEDPAAFACKEKGESCEDSDECCKWPIWMSCVWGKCGSL